MITSSTASINTLTAAKQVELHNQENINPSPPQEMKHPQDQESYDGVGLEELKDKHEGLVNVILKEEEELLSSHRKYIDDNVDLVKRQMSILNEVDKPGSDVEGYISGID
jgi:kinesin family protein 2/24